MPEFQSVVLLSGWGLKIQFQLIGIRCLGSRSIQPKTVRCLLFWDMGMEVQGQSFNLPAMQQAFPMGTGDGTTINVRGGEAVHTLVLSETPAHAHNLVDHGHTHTISQTPHNHTDNGHTHGLSDPGHCARRRGSFWCRNIRPRHQQSASP